MYPVERAAALFQLESSFILSTHPYRHPTLLGDATTNPPSCSEIQFTPAVIQTSCWQQRQDAPPHFHFSSRRENLRKISVTCSCVRACNFSRRFVGNDYGWFFYHRQVCVSSHLWAHICNLTCMQTAMVVWEQSDRDRLCSSITQASTERKHSSTRHFLPVTRECGSISPHSTAWDARDGVSVSGSNLSVGMLYCIRDTALSLEDDG